MNAILNYLGILNLILLTMCIAMFFMPDGLHIHLDNFDLAITYFGVFVLYATATMLIIFVNLYCIILLKINRNKQRVKFGEFLDKYNRLKNKEVVIDIPTRENKPTPEKEPLINSIEDANYEQLRSIFSS